MEKVKRITVDVSKAFHHKVKVKAAKEGKTISEVVRELLKRWLEEEPKPQK